MLHRRNFLKSLVAASAMPTMSWADAGNPAYLSAAQTPDGSYRLFGLGAQGQLRFSVALPTRGHAAAAHPTRPIAVAFARRPGTFAMALDCVSGEVTARIEAPLGRHFYGHGVFSLDGNTLFTTENDLDSGAGVIGIWQNFQRVGEFASNGIGPHEILRLPMTDTLVVANGGILTHPDTGRTKLNLNNMKPNLSYLSSLGEVLDMVKLAQDQNSIRHIAVRGDGLVGMAMQWQGQPSATPSLLALHKIGTGPMTVQAPANTHRWLKGYAGSIAFSADGQKVGITSPQGGVAQIFDASSGAFLSQINRADICGLASADTGFLATDGLGSITEISDSGAVLLSENNHISWDNHLVSMGSSSALFG